MQQETVHLQACGCMDSVEQVFCQLPEQKWRVTSVPVAAEGLSIQPHCAGGKEVLRQLP